MGKSAGNREKFRILAFNWHPPHGVITAGGFVRIREIFKKTPEDVALDFFDNDPSILSDVGNRNVCVHEYRMPRALRGLEKRFFLVERVIEWLLSSLSMSAAGIALKIRGYRFDAVYVPSSEQVPALLAGIVAKRVFRIPLIGCNMNIEYYSSFARKFVVMLHNRTDAIITLSEDLAKTLAANGVKAPIMINGVGLDTGPIKSSAESAIKRKEHEAIFVGRHSSTKGIFDLVKIWKIVTAHIPDATLIMVGSCSPGNMAKLRSLISGYGLEDRVVLKGTVDEETKYRLIRESKLCLFPSYLEGWAITPQEALACGLPVVTYDLPVYEENIRPCDAVVTVPVGEFETMAEKAIELLTDGRYAEYEDIGPPFVEKFRWDDVAQKEFQLIRDETGLL